MACLNPSRVVNRRYAKMSKRELSSYALKKFGCHAVHKTERSYYFKGELRYIESYLPPDYWQNVPCGTCFSCLKRKRDEWTVRLLYEIDSHPQNSFITLTFSDEYLEQFKDNYKKPVMLYIDRLRKSLGYRPRYWFISEHGDDINYTGRVHFHGIFFGTSQKSLSFVLMRNKWPYGYSWIGYVKPQTAGYCTKYLLKFDEKQKPLLLCSNGIGSSYLANIDKVRNFHLNNFDPRLYIYRHGKKWPLSQYYKRKIFNEDIIHVLTLNQLLSYQSSKFYLNGKVYTDKRIYEQCRNSYYQYTLNFGMSHHPKEKINYGKLCVSES